MRNRESPGGRSAVPGRAVLGALGFVVVLGVLVLVSGVGLVALVGQRGNDTTWARWSSVGEAFGVVNSLVSALAVAAVMVTWLWQYHLLRDQRADMAAQRRLLEGRAALDMRKMHVDLIRMSLEHRHLAAVWPRNAGSDAESEDQHMYANLLLQHLWLEYTSGMATREQLESNVRYLFSSPTMRASWRNTADSRQSVYVEGGTADIDLATLVDRIWRECEAVLACSNDSDVAEPQRREWATKDRQSDEWAAGNPSKRDPLPPPAE